MAREKKHKALPNHLEVEDSSTMQRSNPVITFWHDLGGRFEKATVLVLLVGCVLSVIPPLSPFGFLLDAASLCMCLVNYARDVKKSKAASKRRGFLGFAKRRKPRPLFAILAMVSLVAFMVSVAVFGATNPLPSSPAPTPVAASSTQENHAQRKAEEEARKKAEEEAKQQEEARKAEEEAKRKQEEAAKQAAAQTNPSGDASQVLGTLPIKGRAPKTGYSRDQFGPSWSDVDHNGCDTRNDILKRDLTNLTFKAGTHDCVVLTGTLDDPYTALTISFQRGQGTSNAVQIDHVVALSDAWQKGAQQLNEDTRKSFANDPYNLLAVDGPANMQKSDGDAATWPPSNKSFRCEYVARQIGVKHKYSLWVTQAEHDAMANILASCPGQTIPEDGGVVTPVQSTPQAQQQSEPQQQTQQQAPAQPAQPAQQAQPQSDGDVYYKNCSAVRAAGKAPIHAGDTGYGKHLDRDGDGVGCE